jgi:hypothetical protein
MNGIVVILIGNKLERKKYIDYIKFKQDIAYVGLDDIKDIIGSDDLHSNIIISNLKTFISLNKLHILVDVEMQTERHRRVIIDIVKKSSYKIIGMVLDNEDNGCIIEPVSYDEGFHSIYHIRN